LSKLSTTKLSFTLAILHVIRKWLDERGRAYAIEAEKVGTDHLKIEEDPWKKKFGTGTLRGSETP